MTPARGSPRMSREAEAVRPLPSLLALCGRVVDYAGTFPPARLELAEAAARYARYRRSEDRWMLNRFVVAAPDRHALDRLRSADALEESPWRLSAVCSGPEDLRLSRRWKSPASVVESVEVRAPSPEEVPALADAAASDEQLFVELSLPQGEAELTRALGSLKRRNAMLKVRLGGERPGAIPSASTLARVLSVCAELRLPMKATAGLHQALRSSSHGSHGFVNLLLGATLAHEGGTAGDIEALLDDAQPESFRFEAGAVTWRERRFEVGSISDCRRGLFLSFGSCSFDEPLESLAALALRP